MNEFTHIDELRDVIDAYRHHTTPAAASSSSAASSSTSTSTTIPLLALRSLLTTLTKEATSALYSQPTHSSLESSFTAIEIQTRSLLLVALGLVKVEEKSTTTASSSASSTPLSSSAQSQQQQSNNNLLRSEACVLPLYMQLLHMTLLQHRRVVREMLFEKEEEKNVSEATTSSINPSSPHLFYSHTLSYNFSLKLLRRVLMLLHALVAVGVNDANFMKALVEEYYLLPLLLETLSVIHPSQSDEEEAADEPPVNASSDNFVVEYSGASMKLSSKPTFPSKSSSSSQKGSDPSTSPSITSSYWRAQIASDYKQALTKESMHSASFYPLQSIVRLAALVVQGVNGISTTNTIDTSSSSSYTKFISRYFPTSQPKLYPFQLQEVCEILSKQYGCVIVYAPEYVGVVEKEITTVVPTPIKDTTATPTKKSLLASPHSHSKQQRDPTLHSASDLHSHPSITPPRLPSYIVKDRKAWYEVTKEFPFLMRRDAGGDGEKSKEHTELVKQLKSMAGMARECYSLPAVAGVTSASTPVSTTTSKTSTPSGSRPGSATASSSSSTISSASSIATLQHSLFTHLLPHLKRYITSMSRLLLVLTPGFDFGTTASASVQALEMNAMMAEASTNGSSGATSVQQKPTRYIDLRQLILHSSSLTTQSSAEDENKFYTFAMRQTKEVLLESLGVIMMNLFVVAQTMDRGEQQNTPSSTPATTTSTSAATSSPTSTIPSLGSTYSLSTLYLQQLLHETHYDLILAKILGSIDLHGSLSGKRSEDVEQMKVCQARDWKKLTSASSSLPPLPSLTSGFSSRFLRGLTSCSLLLYISLSSPSSSSSSLLAMISLFRYKIPSVLADLVGKQMLKEPQGIDADNKLVWEKLREFLSLTYREFTPLLIARANTSTDKKLKVSDSEKVVLEYLSKHPTASYHSGYLSLLYSSSSYLAALLTSPSAALGFSSFLKSCGSNLSVILHELSLVQRARFPYGYAAYPAGMQRPSSVGVDGFGRDRSSSHPTGSPTSSATNNTSGSSTSLYCSEASGTYGIGYNISPTTLHGSQSNPYWVGIVDMMCKQDIGGVGRERNAAISQRLLHSRTLHKPYDTTNPIQDTLRLYEDRLLKLDRFFAVDTRGGDHASTLLKEGWDLYPTSLGVPSVLGMKPQTLTIGIYLLLKDIQRSWRTESWFLSQFSLEISCVREDLVKGSIQHRKLTDTQMRKVEMEEKRRGEEEEEEKWIACGRRKVASVLPNAAVSPPTATASSSSSATPPRVPARKPVDPLHSVSPPLPSSAAASAAAAASASSNSSLDFFTHPFLPSSTALTPSLYTTLLPSIQPVQSALYPQSTSSFLTQQSKKESLVTGRVELTKQQLQEALEELIQTGEFDD